LNKEIVIRAKLTNLLEEINSGEKDKYDLQQIINDLEKIEDLDYVLSFCIDLKLPTYEDTLTILNFSNQIIKNSNKVSKDNNLVLKIQQYIKRLGTYIIIKKGSRIHKGIPFDPEQWQQFKDSDIIEDIKSCFYYGNILLGIVIWRRHLMGKYHGRSIVLE